jgi:hypothetical protein
MQRLMTIIMRKILNESVTVSHDLNYLLLLESLLQRDSFLNAVIGSACFEYDLEVLYTVHAPS